MAPGGLPCRTKPITNSKNTQSNSTANNEQIGMPHQSSNPSQMGRPSALPNPSMNINQTNLLEHQNVNGQIVGGEQNVEVPSSKLNVILGIYEMHFIKHYKNFLSLYNLYNYIYSYRICIVIFFLFKYLLIYG